MKRQTQVQKNLDLSAEMMDFLIRHPEASKALPKSASFVAFSEQDTKLNQENLKLIDVLLAEGKRVVKAIKTTNPATPWKFDVVPPA